MSHDSRPPAPPPPAQIASFVQVLGIEGAVRFLLAYGGADLVFARNPSDGSDLVRMIGRDAVITLAEIPRLPRRIPLAKPWLAAHFHAQGHSVAQIARTLRVSDTAVRGYLRRVTASPEYRCAEAERHERSRKAAREVKGL